MFFKNHNLLDKLAVLIKERIIDVYSLCPQSHLFYLLLLVGLTGCMGLNVENSEIGVTIQPPNPIQSSITPEPSGTPSPTATMTEAYDPHPSEYIGSPIAVTDAITPLSENNEIEIFPGSNETQVDASGVLTAKNLSPIFILTCQDDLVKINGANPSTGPATCASIIAIRIYGGPEANKIDLDGVSPILFSSLNEVLVDGGDGDDTIIASDFSEVIIGGAGNDAFVGTQSDDEVDPGPGQNFFMEKTIPVESNAPVNSGGMIESGGGPANISTIQP